ncbi:MAG: M28 family peptidase [Bryobacteraceae bacterium]
MRRILSVLIAFTTSAFGAERSPLTPLVSAIQSGVKPERAMNTMRSIYATDRWFTFPKFEQTTQYLSRRLSDAGLSNIAILGAPADGKSQFGFWTMPLAWDVKNARLDVLQPEHMALADYQSVPASVGMWCGPTPPEGIVAEVVDLASTPWNAVKGKLVLTEINSAGSKWELVHYGALGAINGFSENPDLRDDRQWINAWGDNGWAFTRTSTPLLSFSITPRQAEELRKWLREGRRVKVRAQVDSRYYVSRYPYVTAVLPGTDREEEVLTLGHSSEQGANDNATGVSAMIEAVATLRSLIDAGKLRRPKRSIRILTMPELYGSMHYVVTHPERIQRTVAAMAVDAPAAFYNLASTEYTFHLNPQVASSFTDALVLRIANAYLSGVEPGSDLLAGRSWHWEPYAPGTDSYLSDPTIGVPTVWPYSGTGVISHHNTADRPDTVDPRSLRDLSSIIAIYLYLIAAADEQQIPWLASITLDRAMEEVSAASSQSLDSALSHEGASHGFECIDYEVERGQRAIQSLVRLAPEERRAALLNSLHPSCERLQTFGNVQKERLQSAGIHSASVASALQRTEAAHIIVKRKRPGTIPLDDLTQDQWDGYPSGAWATVPILALYWCDGKRNLAEVIRLTGLESGPTSFDFVGYFRFLERHGYVEFLK